MPSKVRVSRKLAGAGDRHTIRAEDLDQDELRAGNEITVFREQVASDKVAWFGHGGENRSHGNISPTYADIVASGNGTGAAGDPIQGELVLAVTDSDGRVLADRTFADLEDLREAVDERRVDRPIMAAMQPVARSDRYLELRIEAADSVDGNEVDPDASEVKLYYTTN